MDMRLLDHIEKVLEFMDMKLLDHLIITRENYFSFIDEGVM